MRPMCQLLLLLSLTLLAVLPARAGHSPPQVILRIHIQTAGEGLSPQEAISIPVPPDGQMIQIRAIPEVSEKDLVDVKTDGSGSVFLFLNHRGKVNLDAATGENQGKILVVLLNGYVIYAPTIDEQITNGVFVIPHPLPAQVVQELQEIAKKNVQDAPPQAG